MLSQSSRVLFRSFVLISTMILAQACGVFRIGAPTAGSESTLVATFASPTLLLPTSTATPAVTSATVTSAATQTPFPVRISALDGNVFIRRGPDLGFNPVGALLDGQSETAMARDVLANWVQIPIPDQPEKTGWISVQTHFIVVTGNVMSLPEVAPTYWPVPAFLQNCTYHQMEIVPGGIVLPSLANFPENRVRVNPGIYHILDTDVSGSPDVLDVELREGSDVEVHVDGNHNKRKCPVR